MIKNKIAKLIDVKSIVTIILTILLAVIILGRIKLDSNVFQLFSSAFMLVLGFFFGKNLKLTEKEEGEKDND
nr:hypothetical protein [Sedimentibacter sp.]